MSKIKSFLLKNTSTGQTIAKNTFWLGASNFGNRVIKLTLMVYAARVLGTSGYGVFSYALGLAMLFAILSDIGLDPLLTREVSSSGKPPKKLIATSFAIKLGLILFSVIALILIAPLFARIPEVIPLLPVVAALIVAETLRSFTLAINRGMQKMELEALINIVTNIAIVSLGIASVAVFATSRALVSAYAIGTGIGLVTALFVLRKYFSGIFKSFDKKIIKKTLKNAWPFALLGLLGIIMLNTDIIMIGAIRGASEVGLYSAAHKPIQVLYSIPVMLASSFLPAVTKFVNKNDKKLSTVMEQTILASLLIGLPIVFGGIVLGEQIIGLLFGSEYIGAALAFQILLVTILITFPSAIIAHAIFAYNKSKNFIGFLILGVFGNIIFNALLIPDYGVVGSAFATIGAALLSNTFIWFRMKKINHFKILPHMKKMIPAGIIMAAFTVLMQSSGTNIFVNILVSALIYFASLKLFKEDLLTNAFNIAKRRP